MYQKPLKTQGNVTQSININKKWNHLKKLPFQLVKPLEP